jgi:hypothetical protein
MLEGAALQAGVLLTNAKHLEKYAKLGPRITDTAYGRRWVYDRLYFSMVILADKGGFT